MASIRELIDVIEDVRVKTGLRQEAMNSMLAEVSLLDLLNSDYTMLSGTVDQFVDATVDYFNGCNEGTTVVKRALKKVIRDTYKKHSPGCRINRIQSYIKVSTDVYGVRCYVDTDRFASSCTACADFVLEFQHGMYPTIPHGDVREWCKACLDEAETGVTDEISHDASLLPHDTPTIAKKARLAMEAEEA